jgi:hypothetical protein
MQYTVLKFAKPFEVMPNAPAEQAVIGVHKRDATVRDVQSCLDMSAMQLLE